MGTLEDEISSSLRAFDSLGLKAKEHWAGHTVFVHILYAAFSNWEKDCLAHSKPQGEFIQKLAATFIDPVVDHNLQRISVRYPQVIKTREEIIENVAPSVEIGGYKTPESDEASAQAIINWFHLLFGNIVKFIGGFEEDPLLLVPGFTTEGIAYTPRTITLKGEKQDLQYERMFDMIFVTPEYRTARGTEAFYDFFADQYEQRSDLVYKAGVAEVLLHEIPGGTILDVGCGTGLLEKWVREKGLRETVHLRGIDLSNAMLKKAREKGEIVMHGDIASVEPNLVLRTFDVPSFDAAIKSFVVHWYSADQVTPAFENTARMLRPGGRLGFNVLHPREDWQGFYTDLLGKTGYSAIRFFSGDINSKEGPKAADFVFAQRAN